MVQPEISFIPLYDVVPRGKSTSLDVLVRITSPEVSTPTAVPPLELAIVLDTSGSMGGDKLEFAKAAARQAVARLGPEDRLHLATFANEVETVAANAGVADQDSLLRAIEALSAGGSTALHGGWARGVSLLRAANAPGRLRRVLLVSDGQANVGERSPEVISRQAQRETAEGIGTSTLGVGLDFNEDLLEAMARRGDGEYHFVESADQLPSIFEAELQSLTRTYGRRCSLGLTAGAAVRILDVLNDLDRTTSGRMMLPNLVHGRSVDVVVRLDVTASVAAGTELVRVRVAWDEVDGGVRRKLNAGLTLPVVEPSVAGQLTPHPEVHERVLLLEAARIKRHAVDAIDKGNWIQARALLEGALDRVRHAPPSASTELEVSQLEFLLRQLQAGDAVSTLKHSKAQSYDVQRTRPRSRH